MAPVTWRRQGLSPTALLKSVKCFGYMYFAIRVGDAMVGRENTGWTVYGVDIPAHARTAHNGLLQKRLEICCIVCRVPTRTQSAKELNWTDLNFAIGVETYYCLPLSKAFPSGQSLPLPLAGKVFASWLTLMCLSVKKKQHILCGWFILVYDKHQGNWHAGRDFLSFFLSLFPSSLLTWKHAKTLTLL